jgi:mono/diheme cytochrome c family protein
MRRVASLAPLAALCALVALAGCGGGETVSPTPETVVGSVPSETLPEGDAAAGKAVFAKQGCGSCHTFAPAGTKGTVGPNLANIPDDATKANQGSVEEYVATSIKDPGSYVVPGFPNGVMQPYDLPDQDLADLVAFLTKSD